MRLRKLLPRKIAIEPHFAGRNGCGRGTENQFGVYPDRSSAGGGTATKAEVKE
jgi:hypothetical protein